MNIFGRWYAAWLRMRLVKLEAEDHAERDAVVTTGEMMDHVDARASDIVRLENQILESEFDSKYPDSRIPEDLTAPTTRFDK